MIKDPIVEEVHRIRRQILAEHGGSLKRWLKSLKASEAQYADRLVSTPLPKRKRRRARAS